MMPNRAVRAGEFITLTGTCGGGYGDPLQRPANDVVEDVRDGYISAETARQDYGVVLTKKLKLDEAATKKERDARQAAD